MSAYVSSLRPPRSEGGMVAWMYRISSAVVRVPQALMKLPPASGGASFRPARSGRWQVAQLARYAARPSAAWPALYPPPVWLRPEMAPIATIAIMAVRGECQRNISVTHSIASLSHIGCRQREITAIATRALRREGGLLVSSSVGENYEDYHYSYPWLCAGSAGRS